MTKNKQQGSAMLEVLIAVLVMSVGLLGLAKLHLELLRLGTDSRHVVTAASLAQNLMDSMTYEPKADAAWSLAKTDETVADSSLNGWLLMVKNTLPDGKATVSCASGLCSIELFWSPGNFKGTDNSKKIEASAKYVVKNTYASGAA